MKYLITETQFNGLIFRFLDSYLKDYSPEETPTLFIFGKGEKNQIAYDKGDEILFIRESLMELVQRMFSLSNTSARKMFKEYFKLKGLRVKRMV